MDLTNYYNFKKLKSNSDQFKKIFFYRICGTGMGAAACLLKAAGYEVAGADKMFYPPMSTYLDNSGIEVYKLDEISLDEIAQNYDLIVVGNVVAKASDDARDIENSGTPFCSFPSAIGALVLEKKKVVGLSGTHGKTTTTYMGVQVFEKLGAKPGHFIGGVMEDRAPANIGEGEFFFIESDEYDSAYFEKYSKFQSYSIDNLVITSLEFDHADIFSSIDDIKNEFRQVIPKADLVIGCDDWQYIKELKSERIQKKWLDYGDKFLEILEESSMGTKFSLLYESQKKTFKTNVIGKHNILNLSSIILVALKAGYSVDEIQKSITDLKMVQRRQELKGEYKGSLIIDDFAHHPTAVEETIKAIKVKYPDRKIHACLEPGSATARSDIFQKQFVSALELADKITIISPSRPTTAIGHGDLDVSELVKSLESSGIDTYPVQDLEKLISRIEDFSNENSVHLVMSNSSCLGLWSSEFVKKL
jgi:UDP-N-acetylmuramate: L-alanyl-gamma-D-glutamyl-meso-diaminopimelate ligase